MLNYFDELEIHPDSIGKVLTCQSQRLHMKVVQHKTMAEIIQLVDQNACKLLFHTERSSYHSA